MNLLVDKVHFTMNAYKFGKLHSPATPVWMDKFTYEGTYVDHLENKSFESFLAGNDAKEQNNKKPAMVVQPTSIKAGEVSYGILLCTHRIKKSKKGIEPVDVLTIMPLSHYPIVNQHFRNLLGVNKNMSAIPPALPQNVNIVRYTYNPEGKTTIYLNRQGTMTPKMDEKVAAVALCNFDKEAPSLHGVTTTTPQLRNYRVLELPKPEIHFYEGDDMKNDFQNILKNIQSTPKSIKERINETKDSFLSPFRSKKKS